MTNLHIPRHIITVCIVHRQKLEWLSHYCLIVSTFRVDPSCITTVRNGELFDARLASEETQSSCQHKLSSPEIQIYASDVHQQVSSGKAGFTSFTADLVVPALPTSDSGQVVYFWPGFKSKQPEMGLPVLQPVLQFGQDGAASSDDDQHSRRLLGGGGGGHWQLQSWFVDGNQHMKYPVVTAPAIAVSPGDKITSYMQLDGDTWTVSGLASVDPWIFTYPSLT